MLRMRSRGMRVATGSSRGFGGKRWTFRPSAGAPISTCAPGTNQPLVEADLLRKFMGLPRRSSLRIRHISALRVFPKSPAKFHDRIESFESFDSMRSHDFASKIEVKRCRRAGSMLVFGKLGSGLAGDGGLPLGSDDLARSRYGSFCDSSCNSAAQGDESTAAARLAEAAVTASDGLRSPLAGA